MSERNSSKMFLLKNNQHSDSINDFMESYFKNKPPDCILYSEDGIEFEIHKELFGQTIGHLKEHMDRVHLKIKKKIPCTICEV